ncbi:hypothetical protein SOM61_02145 [Massilia sp. CFBP9012]|uniref:hypothetical protein n=1 Tax=Massilia sp. CFBP9012 TaxID=3096531 RepID=UPI002A6AF098|nr:hypothetical protein [Massilia sp. CFBP9012]MDY0973749.1 hypothetical protein [Massilia sp. CFBP9012]
MKRHTAPTIGGMALAAILLAACDRGQSPAANGVIQTKYPGQVSSGGLTSGQIMARTARPETDATYAGGTPGIAGGSGGNTSGAETAGATLETGQGPSSGVTQPSSAGREGGNLPSGENRPAAPARGTTEAPAASNAAPQGQSGGTR